jgi:mlo protein
LGIAELMVLGFISLLLTFGQKYIAQICIPVEAADTMLPCPYRGARGGGGGGHRRLLWYEPERRFLAAGSEAPGCKPVIK